MDTQPQTIAGTKIATTRVGFGCGALHHVLPDRRTHLLNAALDAGIRHFDCARMYGNGLAERAVGVVARSRRAEMTIVSKFGIPANPLLESLPALQWPAKAIARVARFVVGSQGYAAYPADRFSAAEADRNLSATLRALCADRVDVYLLHEPQLDEANAICELGDWAEKQQRAGKVRAFGLAGNHAVALATLLAGSPFTTVIQAPLDWNSRAKPDGATTRAPQILYGVYSYSEPRTGDATHIVREAGTQLARVLHSFPFSTVLVSTGQHARIVEAAQTARLVSDGSTRRVRP